VFSDEVHEVRKRAHAAITAGSNGRINDGKRIQVSCGAWLTCTWGEDGEEG